MNNEKLKRIEELLQKRKSILNSIDTLTFECYSVYIKSGSSGVPGTIYVPETFKPLLINELKKEQGEVEEELSKFVL